MVIMHHCRLIRSNFGRSKHENDNNNSVDLNLKHDSIRFTYWKTRVERILILADEKFCLI